MVVQAPTTYSKGKLSMVDAKGPEQREDQNPIVAWNGVAYYNRDKAKTFEDTLKREGRLVQHVDEKVIH